MFFLKRNLYIITIKISILYRKIEQLVIIKEIAPMKQTIFSYLSATLLFFLLGCCSSDKSEENDKSLHPIQTPTTIQENRSTVVAQVLTYYENKENNFVLKIKVLQIEDDGSFPSLATVGYDYFCSPNFAVDENGALMQSEKNDNLYKLKNVSSGKKIKTEIFFQPKTGWHIDKFISFEE